MKVILPVFQTFPLARFPASVCHYIGTMLDIDAVALQVKHNCNISDAKYWGYYSPCGLLLRLRDLLRTTLTMPQFLSFPRMRESRNIFKKQWIPGQARNDDHEALLSYVLVYRIENNRKPPQSINNGEIGKWIGQREEVWQELEPRDFQHLEIQGRRFSPFNVRGINSVLAGHGFIYGAGYGELMKPLFLLAELSEQSVKGKYHINYTGREMARDLSTSPAMIQGNTIFARTETADLFLWNKFEEMKAQKCSGALFQAFSEYGIPRDSEDIFPPDELKRLFAEMTSGELLTYVYYELGEASQRRMLGTWWKRLLLKLPYSRAELYLRGLKDVLSDTCNSGMLAYIIRNKKAGSLGFYVALLSGMRRIIFPYIVPAYAEFTKSQDWDLIEKARTEGYRRAGDYVRDLKALYDKDGATRKVIEEELMREMT